MNPATVDHYFPPSPVMGPQEVARVMGYRNVSALNKARMAGRLPFRMFEIPGRRGFFAATNAVRTWLSQLTADESVRGGHWRRAPKVL